LLDISTIAKTLVPLTLFLSLVAFPQKPRALSLFHQEKIHSVAAAFWKLYQRIQKKWRSPGNTTSFSPMIVDIVKAFATIFGTNIVVPFDFKRQKLGFVRESLKELAKVYLEKER
jgi:hypothetical protein